VKQYLVKAANGWLRVGNKETQSDGLVRLPILSADGHPKAALGLELPRSQQLPTAVSPKNIVASFLLGLSRFSQEIQSKPENRPPISSIKTRNLTGFSGEFFDFSKQSCGHYRFWV